MHAVQDATLFSPLARPRQAVKNGIFASREKGLLSSWPFRSRACAGISALIVVCSLLRIAQTYSHTGQAFDEPCHIAAGMEFLDKGTYTLDAVHPPLARFAIALPLYLAGERYPDLPASDPQSRNYNVVGNHILYDSGHLLRNLALARLGVMPFFILGAVIVYRWAARVGGGLAAVIAVFLYATTPTILAFSSIAYTDIVAASTQLAALFAFSLWLEVPDWARTSWLAAATALALLAKMTTLLFVPAAAAAMLIFWLVGHRKQDSSLVFDRRILGKLVAAACVAAVIVWAGYRFSLRPLDEATSITPANMPSFQHFPGPLRGVARSLVLRNPRLPAAELLHGVSLAWALNASTAQSYLFGDTRTGGWWYFYLVALGVKLPLPLVLLFVVSVAVILIEVAREGRHSTEWPTLLPLAALAAILVATMHVSYQVGVRHVLVTLPLIAIIAGVGSAHMVKASSWKSVGRWAVILLLGWQFVESARAQSDFLAYFNPLAGKDSSRTLVTGCDLDCGQDVFRLAAELRARQVRQCAFAIWSSADIQRSGLPADAPLEAHYHGWIALSSRAERTGEVLHQSFAPDSFAWLEQYRPVAQVGKTIRLYYIPDDIEAAGK